jgi:hypothetical protein
LSLADYYDRRRDDITTAAGQEAAALANERAELEAGLAAEQNRALDPTKKNDELTRARAVAQIKQEIAHVDAQSAQAAAKTNNDLAANELARYTATEQHQIKELEMQKQLAELEGNRAAVAQADAKLRELQLAKDLEQIGETRAQIDAALAEFRAAENIKTTSAGAQTSLAAGTAGLGERKAQIEEKVSAGELLPYQAARQIRQEYELAIPALQKQVDLLREQAAAAQRLFEASGGTGSSTVADDLTKKAQDGQRAIDKLRTEENTTLNKGWMSWKTEAFSAIDQVSSHLTTGLNGWIDGHQRFGTAVMQTWNSIVMTALQSLEKIGEQWIAQHLKMLLIKETTNRAGVASDISAASQKEAIGAAAAKKSIFQSAKDVAVSTWASVSKIPIIGWILAPIAAAAAFAGAIALGAFAGGGPVTRSAAPRFAGFSAGGRIVARSMLGGGMISGPGSSTSDSIPAMLSNGEYVVSAAGTRRAGLGVLDAINRGSFPSVRQPAPYSANGFRQYAGGGSVLTAASGGGVNFNLQTHIGEMNALDGATVRALLEQHGDLVGSIAVAAVKRHYRTNGVGG